MLERVKVKCADGRIVRDPKSCIIIPDEGKMVDPKNPYWYRRIKAGDVIILDQVIKAVPKKRKKKTTKEVVENGSI